MIKKIFDRIKDFFLVPINLIYWEINRPLKPRWLVFEITDRCNSRCRHCDIWSTPPVSNPLDIKEIEETLSDKLFDKLERILLTGGEPTVRPDLEEAILIMHRVRPQAKIWISTNGLLPERTLGLVKNLLAKKIFIGVGVSVDAIGKENDWIRGVPGSFEKADRLIKGLIALRKQYPNQMELAVGFTLSNFTAKFTKEVIDYSRALNVDITVALYEEGSFYHNIGKKFVEREKLIEAAKLLPDSHHNKILYRVLSGKKFKFLCFSMQRFCVLRANGNISTCLKLAHLSAGNVREMSPSEIWQSQEAQKIRKIVKKCPGCLNTWAVGWSFRSYNPIPLLYYSLTKRLNILKKWLRLH